MTKEEQARYYQEAERQRQLHKQLYPQWSNGDNYVGAAAAAAAARWPLAHRPLSSRVKRRTGSRGGSRPAPGRAPAKVSE